MKEVLRHFFEFVVVLALLCSIYKISMYVRARYHEKEAHSLDTRISEIDDSASISDMQKIKEILQIFFDTYAEQLKGEDETAVDYSVFFCGDLSAQKRLECAVAEFNQKVSIWRENKVQFDSFTSSLNFPRIQIAGDTAEIEAYQLFEFAAENDRTMKAQIGSGYDITMQKENGSWRIFDIVSTQVQSDQEQGSIEDWTMQ